MKKDEQNEVVQISPDDLLEKLKALEAENELLRMRGDVVRVEELDKDAAKEAEERAYLTELVPVRLVKTKEKKEDVFVSVNEYRYQIQRGVKVQVPRFIASLIETSENDEQAALERQSALQQ